MKFEALGLTRPILKALREAGYQAPTPIQEQAIPAALAGRDVLGCARTGTGKTCAFAAPILQRLSAARKPGGGIRALVLAPTRELALQDGESFLSYGKYLPLKTAVIFGGVGQTPQVELLQAGCDVLVATPGRLEDLHSQGHVELSGLEILVLDEADRMLDMGFIHDVKKILAWLPKKKQTLFFSATMPAEITALVDSLLQNPVKIAVDPVSSPVEVIEQRVYPVDRGNKTRLLVHLLTEEAIPSALVFTRTKHGANRVAQELTRAGIAAAAIHGNKSQSARQAALTGFKEGSVQVLVATDLAARGLDIEDLACVFNYNLPEVPETYVHRIGRTGRAGKGGKAISFCDYGEQPLLRDIEALLGKAVNRVENHPYPMEILEAPARDAKGRTVNAEDAEARAAAKSRHGGSKTPATAPEEPISGQSTPKKKKKAAKAAQRPGTSEAVPPAPPRAEKKAKKPAREQVQAPPPAEQPPAAKPAEGRKYKRPERKPMSALDEIAPIPGEMEQIVPTYGEKRTGHLRNTFFTPEEQQRYSGEPEPFVDATTRLFATRKAIPLRYQETERKKPEKTPEPKPEKGENSPERRRKPVKVEKREALKPVVTAPQPKKAAKPVEKPLPDAELPIERPQPMGEKKQAKTHQRKKKKSSKSTRSGDAVTVIAAEGEVFQPTEGKGGKKKPRPQKPRRSIYGAHKKDSTEQENSLMKPYYLSDED